MRPRPNLYRLFHTLNDNGQLLQQALFSTLWSSWQARHARAHRYLIDGLFDSLRVNVFPTGQMFSTAGKGDE